MSATPVSIRHFRDVGSSINAFSNQSRLKPRTIYVCASLEDALPKDQDTLRLEIGIKTVVNLRPQKTFVEDKTKPGTYVSLLRDGFALSQLLGLTSCSFELITPKTAEQLVRKNLSPSLVLKLLFQSKDRVQEALNLALMRDVFSPGVIGYTCNLLDHGTTQIGALFNQVLALSDSYPLVLSDGENLRDSSTLLILILLLLDVPIGCVHEDIAEASAKTRPMSPLPEWSTKVKDEFQKMSIDAKAAQMAWVPEVKRHLDETYGGVEGYLRKAGVSAAALASVKQNLLAEQSEKLIDLM